MDEFVLIMRHPDGQKVASPEQIQIWMKQTMDWLGDIAAQDKLVSRGNGLSFDDSRVVRHGGVVDQRPIWRHQRGRWWLCDCAGRINRRSRGVC